MWYNTEKARIVFLACVSSLGCSSVNYQTQETRSRLSRTVEQVLRDSMALPYYLHFMVTRSAEHLARFWLEAESFRSTSWSRVRAHSLNSVKHSSLAETASSLGFSTSPDSPPTLNASPGVDEGEYEDTFTSQTPFSPRDANYHCEAGRRDSVNHEEGLRLSRHPSTSSLSSRTGTPVKGQAANALRELSDKLMKSEYWVMDTWHMCEHVHDNSISNVAYVRGKITWGHAMLQKTNQHT